MRLALSVPTKHSKTIFLNYFVKENYEANNIIFFCYFKLHFLRTFKKVLNKLNTNDGFLRIHKDTSFLSKINVQFN